MKNQIAWVLAMGLSTAPAFGQLNIFGNLKSSVPKAELIAQEGGNLRVVPQGSKVIKGTRVKVRVTFSGNNLGWKRLHAEADLGSGVVAGPDLVSPSGISQNPAIIETQWGNMERNDIAVRIKAVETFDAANKVITSDGRMVFNLVAAPQVEKVNVPGSIVSPSLPSTTFKVVTVQNVNPNTFEVPRLTGLTPDAASAALRNAGYSGSPQMSKAPTPRAAEAGKILAQNPAPGTWIPKSGVPVQVKVGFFASLAPSNSPNTVTGPGGGAPSFGTPGNGGDPTATMPMPDFVGKPASILLPSFQNMKFKGSFQPEYVREKDPGRDGKVVAQSPAAGQTLSLGRGVIKMTITEFYLVMPNLVGLSTDAAQAALAKAGYTAAPRATKKLTSDHKLDHTVAEQHPAPGGKIKLNDGPAIVYWSTR